MAEFTSLNGYQVKDTVARSIAKGRNQAVAFTDYATMIEALNELEKDEYKAGQNIYIGVVGVPDLWVYSVEDIRHTFIYESDDDIVDKLKNNTTVQVGFFKLAMLEGQKVDLTTYDQKLLDIDGSLTNENNETFNFGIKDGVRGFFTNPSRADDSFIPFRGNWKLTIEYELISKVTIMDGGTGANSTNKESVKQKLIITKNNDVLSSTIEGSDLSGNRGHGNIYKKVVSNITIVSVNIEYL